MLIYELLESTFAYFDSSDNWYMRIYELLESTFACFEDFDNWYLQTYEFLDSTVALMSLTTDICRHVIFQNLDFFYWLGLQVCVNSQPYRPHLTVVLSVICSSSEFFATCKLCSLQPTLSWCWRISIVSDRKRIRCPSWSPGESSYIYIYQ